MTPIRLIAIATLAICGLFLAPPAMSAAVPTAPAPGAPAVADSEDGKAMPAQYAHRDRNPGWNQKRSGARSGARSGDRSRNREWGGDRGRYRDKRRDRRDYRERDRSRYHWDYDRRERWKTRRHPRYPYWKGRYLPPHGRYLVITNYWDYYLPRPPHGHFYVRDGDDVFLVLEATRAILDAFILFELLDR
jgi:Ni/Co efflux regulator RcnB